MSGWVKIHRKIVDHALLGTNAMARHLFFELLLEAAWSDRTIDDRGRPLMLKRGQLRMSVREISEKTGMSSRNIRTILSVLTNHNIIEIDTRTGKHATIITICNYSKYQDYGETTDKQTDKHATNTRQTYKEEEEVEEERTTQLPVRGRSLPMAKQFDLPTDMDPDLEQIRQAWNAYAKDTGKAQVRKLTKDRRDRIRQIMADNGYTFDDFAEAMEKASQSNYLVEEGWFTFDWLWKADSNLSKVCEGNYGNGRHAQPDFMHGMTPKEYQQYLLNGGR